MRTEQQIEAAAAAAAEKANGGKFFDPLFYKPEHQAFWKGVIRAAFDAADAPTKPADPAATTVSAKEVEEFSGHCAYIRSVYSFAIRIFRDVSETDANTMNAIAPTSFQNMSMALSEFLVNAACRITEATRDQRGNENFTLELFVNSFPPEGETYKQLDALRQRIDKFRKKIIHARHKLAAHADRAVIRKGEPLATASWAEWDDFWSALRDFVLILNEKTTGKKVDIDAFPTQHEAARLLKALSKGASG